jgi:hypothetical protein
VLSSLRKHGSRNVTNLVDSRFRGNDKLFYIIVIERLIISFRPKPVSSSNILNLLKNLLYCTNTFSKNQPKKTFCAVIHSNLSGRFSYYIECHVWSCMVSNGPRSISITTWYFPLKSSGTCHKYSRHVPPQPYLKLPFSSTFPASSIILIFAPITA